MSQSNTLTDLKITMKKHPDSLKLEGSLKELLDNNLPLNQSLVLYDGLLRFILIFNSYFLYFI